MAVYESPATYKTSDGAEYADKAEAGKHEELVIAERAYKDALRDLGRVVADSQKTADGEVFRLSRMANYYHIVDPFYGEPRLEEVSFYGVDFYFDKTNELVIQTQDHKEPRRYKVKELYSDRRNADRALLKVQEAWLKKHRVKIEAERKRLFG